MMRGIFRSTTTALLALALAGATALAEDSGIRLDQAWARATPGAAKTGAIYLTIKNAGTAPDTLTGASTPAAAQAALHQMKMENGIMQMRPVPTLAIGPGQSVVLDPATGYHIMLTGLKAPLKEGDAVPISLTFEHAGTQQTTATVAKIGAMHAGEMSAMPGMSMPGMQH